MHLDTFQLAYSFKQDRDGAKDAPLTAHEKIALKNLRIRLYDAHMRTLDKIALRDGKWVSIETWTDRMARQYIYDLLMLLTSHEGRENWKQIREILADSDLDKMLPKKAEK